MFKCKDCGSTHIMRNATAFWENSQWRPSYESGEYACCTDCGNDGFIDDFQVGDANLNSDPPSPCFKNQYRCPGCHNEWEDEWDCGVDDECPKCGLGDISPVRSEQLPEM